ncbi:MAG: tRNA (adenosine(37)-N6)-dimethylallyltransferase MiaA [Actinomycetota bacterium]|nr:tRNA (adenosine(37)-N6)-dimethylallyltransferase MiaA [Actinomycetota bacterium]
MSVNPVVVIVGATAVGKSQLGLQLAVQLDTEIINADSMQLYRGMDIGTAKLPLSERAGITHHLIDTLDVTEISNVSMYQQQAREIAGELRAQNKAPLVVGGSGLYVTALLDDLNFPETDFQLRAQLEEELINLGPGALHQRLQSLDPVSADRIDLANGRRIVRALEVIELTGEPFASSLPKSNPALEPDLRIALIRDRVELDARIEHRVHLMWESGFVAEVEQLLELGLADGVTARKALGYAQIIEALNGDISMATAKTETIRLTKRYARKQESWFRRDPKMQWLQASRSDLLAVVLQLISESRKGI